MQDRQPGSERAGRERVAWTGSALIGVLALTVPAWAQAPPAVLPTLAAFPAVLAQAAGTAKTKTGAEAVARVEIRNYEFLPAVLTVPAGTTVTWTSHDDDPHTVTSSENVFASPGLDADETFSYTFSTPGTYPYVCKLHPQMTGTIIVK